MMIIVTKPSIIIDVVGSYFYDKKIMTENGLFVLGGPETQLHDILWAVHDGKNHGRIEGEVQGVAGYGGRSGAERCAFLSCIRTCVQGVGSNRSRARHWALTEPERLHCRLRVTEPERWIDGC